MPEVFLTFFLCRIRVFWEFMIRIFLNICMRHVTYQNHQNWMLSPNQEKKSLKIKKFIYQSIYLFSPFPGNDSIWPLFCWYYQDRGLFVVIMTEVRGPSRSKIPDRNFICKLCCWQRLFNLCQQHLAQILWTILKKYYTWIPYFG